MARLDALGQGREMPSVGLSKLQDLAFFLITFVLQMQDEQSERKCRFLL